MTAVAFGVVLASGRPRRVSRRAVVRDLGRDLLFRGTRWTFVTLYERESRLCGRRPAFDVDEVTY